MTGILQIVEYNILEKKLISRGDQVLVALSGGPDSTALLMILCRLSQKLSFSLGACYINHKIRPRAVKKEIEFCEKLCGDLKIDFILIEDDIPALAKEMKISVEEAGHLFRKAILREIAIEEGYDKIAQGLHLDDTVETILFRIFRGTGPQGLNPIKPRSDIFIRPLFNLPKSDLLGFLRKIKQPYLLDRSNLKSDYSRNYIRNKILPAVEKHFGNKIRQSVFNLGQIIGEENTVLEDVTTKELRQIAGFTPGGKIIVDLERLSAYDSWLKRRLIKKLLDKIGGRPGFGSFADVERIIRLAEGKYKAFDLAGRIKIVRYNDRLYLLRGKTTIKRRELKLPGTTPIEGLMADLRCGFISSPRKAIMKTQKAGMKINIDFDKISPPLSFRSIKTGDSFTPLGMKGTRKVGNFLTDKKIPPVIRDEIPVVADRKGIIWLVGHQLADRVKIDKKTGKVLELEFIGKKDQGFA
nr:tRNA lysidine(34) synthetase TilS [candidate division Zixibacteria bacterium]